MCSSRFVEPPNAACTAIALRIAAGREDVARRAMPRSASATSARADRAGHVEPDRLARRRERGVRQRQAERLADDLRRGRRAEELAAAAGRGAGAAAELGRFLQRDQRRARSARRCVCTLPASSPSLGGQRDAAGHEHAGQVARSRPAPSSSPAGPCRRWRRRARPAPGQRADQPAEDDAPRRCGTAGCRTCPCVPCVRPSHGSVTAAGERHRAAARRSSSRGRLHQQADLPVPGVITRARSACRPARAGRPAC